MTPKSKEFVLKIHEIYKPKFKELEDLLISITKQNLKYKTALEDIKEHTIEPFYNKTWIFYCHDVAKVALEDKCST